MMGRRWGRGPALSFLGMMWVSSSWAQLSILDKEVQKATGSRLEVVSVFDKLPPSGFAPVRVTATNGSGKPEEWRLAFVSATMSGGQDHSASSTFYLPVPAKATRSAVFLVPQSVVYGNPGYRGSDRFDVVASSRSQGTHNDSQYEARVDGFPSIAMSKPLAAATLSKLEDELEIKIKAAHTYGASQRVFASRFDPAQLPEDWLGYSGLDYLLMRPADWERLSAGQRRAILQWVRLGGALHLYKVGKADLKDLGMPGVQGTRANWSQGELAMFEWSGKDLPSKDVVNRYWGGNDRLRVLKEEYATGGTWGLVDALGSRSFAAWQVLVFLALFGVLVGPVNLFVLAPPEEATAFVSQEQMSRTGVLTSSGFTLAQPMLLQAVALPESPWVKLTNGSQSQSSSLKLSGLEVGGSLFQSRAEQAQVMQTVISTRARMEVKRAAAGDVAPVLVSALGFPVEELFYLDDQGGSWKAKGPVTVGSEVTFERTNPGDMRKWWNEARKGLGHVAGQHAKAVEVEKKGRFFALAKSAPSFLQDTLPSIRWEDDQVLVFGPVHQP